MASSVKEEIKSSTHLSVMCRRTWSAAHGTNNDDGCKDYTQHIKEFNVRLSYDRVHQKIRSFAREWLEGENKK